MALVYQRGRGMGDFKSFLKGVGGAVVPNLPNIHINAQTGASVGKALATGAKTVAGSALKNLLVGKQAPPTAQMHKVNYVPWLVGGGVVLVGAFILLRRK